MPGDLYTVVNVCILYMRLIKETDFSSEIKRLGQVRETKFSVSSHFHTVGDEGLG